MADISTARITCLTTPTLLVTADTDGCRVLIHKEQQHSIYIGDASVTTSTGFLFDHAGTIDVSLPANAKLYACSTSGTEIAYVLKIGNN